MTPGGFSCTPQNPKIHHFSSILDAHLIAFLQQKVDRLRARYVACWRILRCNRHGDPYTNRRRIFIVGIKREYLRGGLDPDTVDLFPPDRPADVSPGLGRYNRSVSLTMTPHCVSRNSTVLGGFHQGSYQSGTTVFALWQKLMTLTASDTTSTTQLAPRRRSGPTATGRAWRRDSIGSTESADVCHSERPLELTQSPKPPLTK